jgi:Tfp pilus assembly protein PilZ
LGSIADKFIKDQASVYSNFMNFMGNIPNLIKQAG